MESNFPATLRFIRGKISVRIFAKRCGISPSSLQRYEKGEVSPNLRTMERMAKKLDIKPEIFTGGEDLKIISAKDLERLRRKAEGPGVKK